jgi:hypothetical protein
MEIRGSGNACFTFALACSAVFFEQNCHPGGKVIMDGLKPMKNRTVGVEGGLRTINCPQK